MIDLVIDNLTFGGRGLGRHEGKAVFVPDVIPGEKVRCRITKDHKRHSEAELIEILEASPERIKPLCPVASECGGCQWQHLPYDLQLQWKSKLFRESISRALAVDDLNFQPIVASPSPWEYRCRARIKCRVTESGFEFGFYRAGTHDVVDIAHCPLLAPVLNRLLSILKPLFADFPLAHRIPQIDLSSGDNGHAAIRLVARRMGPELPQSDACGGQSEHRYNSRQSES